jgi:hypothetical protein
LALVSVGVGLVGLGIQTKQQEQAREFDDWVPEEIHIYRQYSCWIERGLIDKFTRMDTALRQNIRGQKWVVDWNTYQQYRDKSDKALQVSDLQQAFREQCRALNLLARTFNKHRQKEEDFRPNWESPE